MQMEKPENFIFPAPYFDENSLPSYKNYLIQIPTGKKIQKILKKQSHVYLKNVQIQKFF